MKIEVIPSVDELKNDDLYQKTVIIIDVLRTSSTIISALANGIEYVLPAYTVGHAKNLKEKDENYLLVGDRYYKKISGFDLNNSPQQLASENIRGKKLVLTTTNGTRGIQKSLKGEKILIGGFLNGKACMNEALRLKKDIILLEVGNKTKFTLEDGLAAGYLIEIAREQIDNIELNDFGIAMHAAFKQYQNTLVDIIKKTDTAKKLIQHGFSEDIDFSCEYDRYPICPYYDNGKILIAK